MPEQWDLLFTLPNLSPPIPAPFESDGYVICSGTDPKLEHLAGGPGNNTARKILERFRTPRGKAYWPGCFLVRADIPVARRDPEAIRAFRNLCAISTTTATYALGLDAPQAAQWHVAWSDQFQFGYFVAGQSGWVQTLNGASIGMDHEIPQQQPDAQFSDPTSWSLSIDRPLLERLLRCWQRCYQRQKDRRRLLRLFRSLEVAFHASLFPADGLTSINDIGTRLALWVSAFEVLCHPGGKVDKRTVQKVISDAPFTSKSLRATRYTISHRQTKHRVTLPEALYDDLYDARNRFLHGEPVVARMLRYRQSDAYAPLTQVAPVLFNAALVSYLDEMRVPGGPLEFSKLTKKTAAQYTKSHEGIRRVSTALEAAGRPIR